LAGLFITTIIIVLKTPKGGLRRDLSRIRGDNDSLDQDFIYQGQS